MFELWQYVRFQFSARTEYGIHSPFVYGLLTGAVYRKPRSYRFDKGELARRIAGYLRCPVVRSEEGLNWEGTDRQPENTDSMAAGDMWVFPSPTEAMPVLGVIDKNCVLYIHRPHANRRQHRALKHLLEQSAAEVAVDFFWGAVLIPRPGQHRERFRVRLKH